MRTGREGKAPPPGCCAAVRRPGAARPTGALPPRGRARCGGWCCASLDSPMPGLRAGRIGRPRDGPPALRQEIRSGGRCKMPDPRRAAGPAFPVPRQRRRRAVASPGGKREHVRVRRSEGRILTTHTGSLPRPAALTRLYARRVRGEAVDEAAVAAAGREALARIVPLQLDAGLDVINNGEQQRESFALYLRHRLTGFGGESVRAGWADVDAYPEFKAEFLAQGAAKEAVSNTSFLPAAVGPVAYKDPSAIQGRMRGVPRRPRAPRRPLRGSVPDRAFSRHRRLHRPEPALRHGGALPGGARHGAAHGVRRRSSTPVSCCNWTAPTWRWSATAPIGTGRSRTSSPSASAWWRRSTPPSRDCRGSGSGCTSAGATTRRRTTGTCPCRTSCRSSAGPASAASCCLSRTRATRTSTAASPRRRWTGTRSSSPASSTR